MVIGAAYGVVLFGELRAALVAAGGAALVAAAGIYAAWREMRRHR